MRELGVGIVALLVLPAVLGAGDPALTSTASLTLVEDGVTRALPDGTLPLQISCTALKACNGDGCTPVPALLLGASETGIAPTFTLNVMLSDPAPAGTTLRATAGGTTPVAGEARVTVMTGGVAWAISGGSVRIDANEFPTTGDHLALTLTGVTDGSGRTLDGTIVCISEATAASDDGGCGGGGGRRPGGGGIDD